jgi:MSHA biogenesis protein MshJ
MKAQTTIDLALLRRRLAPLLQAWERQAKRIDALSLRERAILFLCVVAVVAALFETFVMSPLAAQAKLRREAQAKQVAELTQLRAEFTAASQNSDDAPTAQLRRQLDAARAERERLDSALSETSASTSGEGLSAVLQRLLAQQPGLVLERLALLDDAPAGPAAGAASAPRAMPALMPGMSWQGVELQVQGSYRDAQRYLQALERELPGLRWGERRLSAAAGGQASRLSAQVFLLRVQP